MSNLNPITVALWTPQGRGAIATLRVCGDLQILDQAESPFPFRAVNGRGLLDQPLGRIVFGHWGTAPAEDVVVCRLNPTEFEVHCHGGVSAARRIMNDLNAANVLTVDWTDQARQATGVLATDCLIAVTQATTLRAASILLDQEAAWRDFAERAIDLARRGDWQTLHAEIATAMEWTRLGRHLLEPFQVVLTGPPNVGKSALLNVLVGYQRAVVFDQPGTTRDVVTAETAFDGWPVRLIDTAGLRAEATGLEAAGIQLAHQQIEKADLILRVVDASEEAPVETASDVREIVVANKIDLVSDLKLTMLTDGVAVPVSAITGAGIEQLIATVAERLVSRFPSMGTLVPFHERQRDWLMRLRAAVDERSVGGVSEVTAEIVVS